MSVTKFRCPKCKKIQKVGKLHASYTCPTCHCSMIITLKEKQQGHKTYKKNFMFNSDLK